MSGAKAPSWRDVIKPRGIGDNNPPPDEPQLDPLFDLHREYLQRVVLDRARPVALEEIVTRLLTPRLQPVISQIYDMMMGPPAVPAEAGAAMMQLVKLIQQPAKLGAECRRASALCHEPDRQQREHH